MGISLGFIILGLESYRGQSKVNPVLQVSTLSNIQTNK